MISIDKLHKDDLPELATLYNNAFESSASHSDSMLSVFDRITNDPNYIVLCARMGNKLVGSVMGMVCYELFGTCKPFMVVENVAVLSDYRRKGIARQLLVQLEAEAKLHQCTTILFVSSAHRAGAHKLYESLGFGEDKVNGYRKRLA